MFQTRERTKIMSEFAGPSHIQIQLADDRREIRVHYRNAAGVSLVFSLNAEEASQFCALLANCRSLALPEIPRQQAGQGSVVVNDPVIALHAVVDDQRKLLSIRHPGFGWLCFALSETVSEALGDALSPRAQAIESDPSKKRLLH